MINEKKLNKIIDYFNFWKWQYVMRNNAVKNKAENMMFLYYEERDKIIDHVENNIVTKDLSEYWRGLMNGFHTDLDNEYGSFPKFPDNLSRSWQDYICFLNQKINEDYTLYSDHDDFSEIWYEYIRGVERCFENEYGFHPSLIDSHFYTIKPEFRSSYTFPKVITSTKIFKTIINNNDEFPYESYRNTFRHLYPEHFFGLYRLKKIQNELDNDSPLEYSEADDKIFLYPPTLFDNVGINIKNRSFLPEDYIYDETDITEEEHQYIENEFLMEISEDERQKIIKKRLYDLSGVRETVLHKNGLSHSEIERSKPILNTEIDLRKEKNILILELEYYYYEHYYQLKATELKSEYDIETIESTIKTLKDLEINTLTDFKKRKREISDKLYDVQGRKRKKRIKTRKTQNSSEYHDLVKEEKELLESKNILANSKLEMLLEVKKLKHDKLSTLLSLEEKNITLYYDKTRYVDRSRAAALWLWDFFMKRAGTVDVNNIPNKIKDMARKELKIGGKNETTNWQVIIRDLRITKKCINNCKVIKMH